MLWADPEIPNSRSPDPRFGRETGRKVYPRFPIRPRTGIGVPGAAGPAGDSISWPGCGYYRALISGPLSKCAAVTASAPVPGACSALARTGARQIPRMQLLPVPNLKEGQELFCRGVSASYGPGDNCNLPSTQANRQVLILNTPGGNKPTKLTKVLSECDVYLCTPPERAQRSSTHYRWTPSRRQSFILSTVLAT